MGIAYFAHSPAPAVASGLAIVALTIWVAREKPEERPSLASVLRLLLLSGIAFLLAHEFSEHNFNIAWRVCVLAWKLLFAAAAVKLAGVLIFGAALPAFRFPVPRIMRDLSVSAVYITAGILVLSHNGMTISGVVTTSAVLTAVVGFSLQDTLGNVMSGLAIQMDQTLNVGDWIQLDKYAGRVKEIGWRHTAIETRNWDTVFIPNSRLMREEVTVLGRRQFEPIQHRQWVYFNVDFRYAPGEVIATVERALRKGPIENVAFDPEPQCIACSFEDSFVRYAVRYWLKDLARDDYTDSLVRQRVYYALTRGNIPLSLPAQTLFTRSQNTVEKEKHEEREVDRRLAALSGVDIFKQLTPSELRMLAGRLHFAPFAQGELVMKQGGAANWLYIMISGSAIEEVSDPAGKEHLVTRLQPGDVFGEMSLLTGAPRSATVVAEDDVRCYRLDPEGFRDIIHARPEIGTYMSQILAQRKMEMEKALHQNMPDSQQVSTLSDELLSRIYSFFNLGNRSKASGS